MSFFERFEKFIISDPDISKFGSRIVDGVTKWAYIELKDGTRYEIKLVEDNRLEQLGISVIR